MKSSPFVGAVTSAAVLLNTFAAVAQTCTENQTITNEQLVTQAKALSEIICKGPGITPAAIDVSKVQQRDKLNIFKGVGLPDAKPSEAPENNVVGWRWIAVCKTADELVARPVVHYLPEILKGGDHIVAQVIMPRDSTDHEAAEALSNAVYASGGFRLDTTLRMGADSGRIPLHFSLKGDDLTAQFEVHAIGPSLPQPDNIKDRVENIALGYNLRVYRTCATVRFEHQP